MRLSEINRHIRQWLWGAPCGIPNELRDASHRLANETTALAALVAAIKRDDPRLDEIVAKARHEPAHR